MDALAAFVPLLDELKAFKAVRVSSAVMGRLELLLQEQQLEDLAREIPPPRVKLKARLYPYQMDGVRFGLFKRAALIGDEMGLGKTLQAIALAAAKKEVFGFEKVLVITPASLKEQWKREIERFSDETAEIVEGGPMQRRAIYGGNGSYFKITNYEAVLRDVMLLARFKPDLVILDEAQRIKNFSTKTAEAVKSIPRRHSLVLTGTPLENRLEDVYSIVQFLDPHLLSPLWRFAAGHFMLSRSKKGKILGYRNLDRLHAQLKPLVIRRRKEEVLRDLPQELVNNYYLDLHHQQQKIHSGYLQSLIPILNKKYLTPIDLRRIQELLVRMRMVCDSVYLIDRKTHISPKLQELEGIIDEMVVQSGRKMVIFSEWTTMTYLIGRCLSEAGIGFVELSGKVPVNKRQALIDEFSANPKCRVFLSTDAGGTGLNLQAADCVVNFELPWNPARVRQRIGRVNRIGQKSRCINVVNLITKNSIEEKILAGLQLKTDLFTGVFDGGADTVEFTREKRTELLNQLRGMLGEELLLPPASTTGHPPTPAPSILLAASPTICSSLMTASWRSRLSMNADSSTPWRCRAIVSAASRMCSRYAASAAGSPGFIQHPKITDNVRTQEWAKRSLGQKIDLPAEEGAQFALGFHRHDALLVTPSVRRTDLKRQVDGESRHAVLAGAAVDLGTRDLAEIGHGGIGAEGRLLLGHREHGAEVRRTRLDAERGEGGVDVGGPALAIGDLRRHQAHDLRSHLGRPRRLRGLGGAAGEQRDRRQRQAAEPGAKSGSARHQSRSARSSGWWSEASVLKSISTAAMRRATSVVTAK